MRRAAARAGLARAAVHLQRHRQLVGDRVADHLLVVLERRRRARRRRPARSRSQRLVVELGRPSGRATAAPSRAARPPRSGRCRRSCAGRAAAGAGGAAGRAAARTRRPAAPGRRRGPSVATASSASTRVRRGSSLRPRPLLGAELAQAQLAPVLEPDQQPRGAVAQRRALVPQLQPPGRHQVDQHDQLAGVERRASCPTRRTPASVRPASASSGGSNVFIVTMPGASADSICAPAAARDRRRAVISTSGNSGIEPRVGCKPMRISVAADERTGVADAVVEELRRRGHEPLPHGALNDERARRLGLGLGGRRARRGRGPRRSGRRVLLDRHRRLDRREQGGRRPRRALRRRRDRPRRAALERRQRARAVAAQHQPGAARGDPRRLVRGRARARTPTTSPTSATWTRSRPSATPAGQRLALGVAHARARAAARSVNRPATPASPSVSARPQQLGRPVR